MTNCDNCQKLVNKRSPGIECNRCGKTVHLNAECSGLTAKQRTALKAANNLEWMCKECQDQSPKRRSMIIPNEDEEDEEDEVNVGVNSKKGLQMNVKQLLRDISKEIEKTIQKELADITKAVEYQSDKMDELTESVEGFKATIQELKKKNIELQNRNYHLELRIGALEQRMQDTEQEKLSKTIEIINVPCEEKEVISELIIKIANKLQVTNNEIEEVKRLPSRKEQPGIILIKFKNETSRLQWLTASKLYKLTAEDLVPSYTKMYNTNKSHQSIYIREALTHYNKKLLWQTKKELQETFKFVWCKGGIIRARKEENGQVFIIRSEEDLKKILC